MNIFCGGRTSQERFTGTKLKTLYVTGLSTNQAGNLGGTHYCTFKRPVFMCSGFVMAVLYLLDEQFNPGPYTRNRRAAALPAWSLPTCE